MLKGFDTEKELVDYFLKKAYWDNVTVFASTYQNLVLFLWVVTICSYCSAFAILHSFRCHIQHESGWNITATFGIQDSSKCFLYSNDQSCKKSFLVSRAEKLGLLLLHLWLFMGSGIDFLVRLEEVIMMDDDDHYL